MTNKKYSRLDESFSVDTLQKAFTGNTSTAIDTNKIVVTSKGIIQTSNGNKKTQNPTNSQNSKK